MCTQEPQNFYFYSFPYENPKKAEFYADIKSVSIMAKNFTQKKLFAKNFCKGDKHSDMLIYFGL
jgi:hypothetical protein